MGVPGRKPDVGTQHSGTADIVFRPQDAGGTVVLMEPPEELSEQGRVNWNVVLPDLIATKVFRESDSLMLVELCESLALAQRFRRELLQEPDLASPEAKRLRTGYRESMQTVMSISGEFGISPVARLRLGLMKVQGASLVQKLANDADWEDD